MEEIQWWKKFVTIKNGFPVHRIHLTNPKTSAYVDASDTGWGVASTSSSLQDFGRWKTSNIYKLTRVEGDLVCLTAPCRKMPPLNHPDFQRQSYRHQI